MEDNNFLYSDIFKEVSIINSNSPVSRFSSSVESTEKSKASSS